MKRKTRKPTKPARKPTQQAVIAATVHRWAISLAKNEKTLQSLLVRAGKRLPEKGHEVPAMDIFQALFGDEQAEKVRNLKADADRKEREEKEAAGKLFPMDALEGWLVENYIIPMGNIFAGMAATIDTRCNPEQPALARRAIEDYIESTVKPALRAGLEKPKQEAK